MTDCARPSIEGFLRLRYHPPLGFLDSSERVDLNADDASHNCSDTFCVSCSDTFEPASGIKRFR